jgi:hypothetical protein
MDLLADRKSRGPHHVKHLLLTGSIALACAISCPAIDWTLAESSGTDAWPANSELVGARASTITGLGDIQGVSILNGRWFLYGDVLVASSHIGLIHEYSCRLKSTGREIWLRAGGQPVLHHPTGLTQSARWGTFVGDTVNRKAVIYRLDWKQALHDGNLDHAVLDVIDDDAAITGCRPEFVTLWGNEYLATADYGDATTEVRLYDPAALLTSRRSGASGVVAYRFSCGPFNQNLSWNADRGELTCIQNVVAGRGWRLEVWNLARAVVSDDASVAAARVRTETFPQTDELEGFRPLAKGWGLFATSSATQNVTIAKIEPSTLSQSRTDKRGASY